MWTDLTLHCNSVNTYKVHTHTAAGVCITTRDILIKMIQTRSSCPKPYGFTGGPFDSWGGGGGGAGAMF